MKTLNTNRAAELAQLVEHLPKHGTLSSNQSMAKTNKQTNKISHKFASCHQLVLHAGLRETLALDDQTEAVNFW
jgi:hypothetical protein